MSNLIPITRIYDIYPKYTYSNDVKKFMDEIVDIDRVNVFTEADMVTMLDKIRAEIDNIKIYGQIDEHNLFVRSADGVKEMALNIIDKYKNEVNE